MIPQYFNMKGSSFFQQAALVCLLMASTHAALAGSAPFEKIKFEAISTADGLSSNTVKDSVQDARGFLWFATYDGLHKYDGYTFKIFRNDPGDPLSLSDNYLYALTLDGRGNLWVATKYGGLNRLDLESETFHRYRHQQGDGNALIDDRINDVLVDAQGMVWAGSENGITRINPDSGQMENFSVGQPNSEGLVSGEIESFYLDHSGNVWIATKGGGLSKFSPGASRFQTYLHDPEDPHSITSDDVRVMLETRDGTFWVGTRSGLSRLDRETGVFTHLTVGPASEGGLSHPYITALVEDEYGYLWIGTHNGGLNCYDPKTGRISHHDEQKDGRSGLNDGYITSIFKDRSGVFWLGTKHGGVNKFFGNLLPFEHLKVNQESDGELQTAHVRSLFEGRGDALWIGIADGELLRYDLKTSELTTFLDLEAEPYTYEIEDILDVLECRKGRLWLATKDNGVFVYEHEKGIIQQFTAETTPAITHERIRFVYEDQSGAIWVGTKHGLNRINPENFSVTQFINDLDDPRSLPENRLVSMKQTQQGDIWVGTDHALAKFHPDSQDFTVYSEIVYQQSKIEIPGLNCIVEARDGTFWIGTRQGLAYLDRKADTFNYLTESEGGIRDFILGLIEDDRGYLWISTVSQLMRFDPKTKSYRAFSTDQGLVNDHFEMRAFLKTSNGLIFSGGQKGIDFFNPRDFEENTYAPPIEITSVKRYGQGKRAVQLDSLKNRIELSHLDRFISIEFSVLDFVNPEKNAYAFQLAGRDTEWINIGQRNFASFANLEPGLYTFLVKGSNSQGAWNTVPRSLEILVTPPFWKTKVFFVGIGILLLLMILAIYRFLTASLRERNESLIRARQLAEETSRAKSEFLANMSHEIRTPMNGVVGMTEILSTTNLSKEQRQYTEIILSSSKTLMSLINDILDFSKIEARELTLEHREFSVTVLLEEILDMMGYRAAEKNLDLVASVHPDCPATLWGDPTRVSQILINLVGNALKFTEQGQVIIEVRPKIKGDKQVELVFSVTDSGMGIPKDKQKLLFDPFTQIDSSTTRKFGGTGLGLSICKQLVDLMKGTLKLESTLGKGTCFTFTLPFQFEANDEDTINPYRELKGKKALILATHPEVGAVFQQQLVWQGTHCGVVANFDGASALLEAASNQNEPYDLLLLDTSNRLEQASAWFEKVKAKPWWQPMPTVALYRMMEKGIVAKLKSSPFDDLLAKPFQQNQLYHCLVNLVSQEITNEQTKGAEPPQKLENVEKIPTVLLAEDNRINRKVAMKMLETIGCKADSVENGLQAVQAMENGTYDLILMDCQMPIMDGIEATEEIRKKGFTQIPIIAVTANATVQDREKCLAAGMNNFMTKPLQIKQLKDMIEATTLESAVPK
jgi:signal transduction histidine kinase/ligand-binding sensor domain-containing protein/CheY-like chemotaxis protein